MKPGSVHFEQAYALGKMLNNSGWDGRLRNGITPSDIDLCFDNDGHVLFCELSRHHSAWQEIDTGQCWLYRSAISCGHGLAVLLKHSVDPEDGRQIDTLHDVETFQVMLSSGFTSKIVDGSRWGWFVDQFYENPKQVIRYFKDKEVASFSDNFGF